MESSRLADVVPREFYKERDVVMEERRMRVDSDPIGRLVEQFLATAYVAHNYGRSDIGWPSEVSQITATEAMAFHKKYYVGGNVVDRHRGRRGSQNRLCPCSRSTSAAFPAVPSRKR